MCCYWMYLIHCNNHTFCCTLAELWSCTPLHDIGTSNGAELTATSCIVWCSDICPYTSLCVSAQVLYTSHCRPWGGVALCLPHSPSGWLPLHSRRTGSLGHSHQLLDQLCSLWQPQWERGPWCKRHWQAPPPGGRGAAVQVCMGQRALTVWQ